MCGLTLSYCRSAISKITSTIFSHNNNHTHNPPQSHSLSSSTSGNPHSTEMEPSSDENGITHRQVSVNGIKKHVAEKGDGPVVLFIHGFPDLWCTWRHQILALSAQGYRAVAPDMRGYGGTDSPADAGSYTYGHIVGDLVALIDELGVEQVFVVGHDWGAVVAWWLCLFRPDRVKALVNLSVAFSPRNPKMRPIDMLRAAYGEDYYIIRFQVPGEMEAEVVEAGGADSLLRRILSYRTPGPLFLPKSQWYKDLPPYPSWLSEKEAAYYRDTFSKTGFTGGFNYYRSLNLNWEITAPWTRAQVKVPVKFIVGDLDLTYSMPKVKDYIHNGGMKKDVPLLQDVVVLEGVGHFLHQEKHDIVTNHILEFLRKF